MRLSRRHLLSLAPGAVLAPWLMPRARAEDGNERKFLFVYAYGGWDTTMVFTPKQDDPVVDTEEDAVESEAGGIRFVDHGDRPSVRAFFEAYGERTCIINGIEVRSVTHERCQRLMFTGQGSGGEDWAVSLAAEAAGDYPIPHLVLAGPAFAEDHGSVVVRTGESGQLPQLLDGRALQDSELRVGVPTPEAQALEDALVRRNLERFNADARGGRLGFGRGYDAALADLGVLDAMSGGLNLEPEDAGCRRDLAADASAILDAFEAGASRCGLTQDLGWCDWTWDTHSNNALQVKHYEDLFGYLVTICEDLDARGMSEEVTIVVFSEMGRHPKLTSGGRAHWTYTSAMLIGAGIAGSQVIGGLDADFEGEPVDLASGEVHDSGTALLPGHLGATLLALADLDWESLTPQTGPLLSVLSAR